MSGLDLEIGEVSLGHVIHRHAAGDLVDIHEKRHWGLPGAIGLVAMTVRRPGQPVNR